MDARDFIKIGMSAERTLVVPPERTVGHFLAHMPQVYATPMMILEMELTAGDAIASVMQPGWITGARTWPLAGDMGRLIEAAAPEGLHAADRLKPIFVHAVDEPSGDRSATEGYDARKHGEADDLVVEKSR